MSRVLLVGPTATFEQRAQLLLGDAVRTLSESDPARILASVQRSETLPQAVVFGPYADGETVIGAVRALRGLVPTLALLGPGGEPSAPARSAGVTDVISPDADIDEIDLLFVDAASRAAALRRTAPRARRGRVIVVTSPKGGVGKSTVAVNLAVAALQGSGGRVVLVDTDLQFGDAATLLDLSPQKTIVDAISSGAAKDPLLLRAAFTPHPNGLALVAAPRSPAEADQVSPTRLAHLLRQLRGEADTIIVDTSPGLTEHTLVALEEAARVVLVTSPEVASVRAAATALDVIGQLGLEAGSPLVVLNRAESRGRRTLTSIEEGLRATIDAIVPRTRATALAGERGDPVVHAAPRDAAARALRQLVTAVAEESPRRRHRGGTEGERR